MGRFNALIRAPNRLKLCALLASAAEIEFMVLRNHLEVSDSVLSKQIKLLREAGFVKLIKRKEYGRQRTWISLSNRGHKAFVDHVGELKKIVG